MPRKEEEMSVGQVVLIATIGLVGIDALTLLIDALTLLIAVDAGHKYPFLTVSFVNIGVVIATHIFFIGRTILGR